jgi:hypothetical protein
MTAKPLAEPRPQNLIPNDVPGWHRARYLLNFHDCSSRGVMLNVRKARSRPAFAAIIEGFRRSPIFAGFFQGWQRQQADYGSGRS